MEGIPVKCNNQGRYWLKLPLLWEVRGLTSVMFFQSFQVTSCHKKRWKFTSLFGYVQLANQLSYNPSNARSSKFSHSLPQQSWVQTMHGSLLLQTPWIIFLLFNFAQFFAMTFTSKIPGISELVLKLWDQTSHFSLDSSFILLSFHTFPLSWIGKHYIIFENGLEVGKSNLFAGIYSIWIWQCKKKGFLK